MKSGYCNNINVIVIILMCWSFAGLKAQDHPKLILTKKGVTDIKSLLGTVPLFDSNLKSVQQEVDAEIVLGIQVPVPKDFSGGYTHERHKRNFLILQKAGLLFQILGDEKYAEYIKDYLFAYAKLYPTLPLHPQERSYARGKIFWQCLNDSNWLVYVSQAYDCIYDWLEPSEVTYLNEELFKPFADFLSVRNPQFFNRIHNHSTWGNVAVGMIGLVMEDNELVNRALYGLETDNIQPGQKDNDGGLIKVKGQKTGFLANMDEPFSPDGYYTEGPYYQRYAMYPFMIFAEALENVKPELKIFDYKNGVLLKAVYALLNLTDSDGEFYPLNDAQKGMSYFSRELVTAVNIAYYYGGHDPQLLSLAKEHRKVLLDDTGLAVALGVKNGEESPFEKKSIEFRDGPDGLSGGVAIVRSVNAIAELSFVFKYSAQGLSHGHYDKLSYSMYEEGTEIIQDYGLARFVNIEQKGGGNYLKENTTWAKQTIAHNTLSQDGKSHFEGDFETGNKHHSQKYLVDFSDDRIQIASAIEKNAYPGTTMHRTMVMIQNDSYELPLVLDIFKIESNKSHQYDMPTYFMGQVISTNFEYRSKDTLVAFGLDQGYQHLWKEASGKPSSSNAKLTWFQKNRFYTMTSVVEMDDELIFARIGAKDPAFNLRRDAALILRKNNIQNGYFVSCIESHGHYDPVNEIAEKAYSKVKDLKVIYSDDAYIGISIENDNKEKSMFIFSLKDPAANKKHQLKIKEKVYHWTGAYYNN